MAKVEGKSSVYAKIKATVAPSIKTHAGDDTKVGGFTRLPGGINNGIAQLVKCEFFEFKNGDGKGKPGWRAEGKIVSPKSVVDKGNLVVVKGESTSIIVNFYEKGTGEDKHTIDDATAAVMNHFRLLGLDTAANKDLDLEEMGQMLVEAAPFFKFTTRESEATMDPNDPTKVKFAARVWEEWRGVEGLEGYVKEAPGGVVDGAALAKAKAEVKAGGSVGAPVEDADTFDLEGDLDSLAEKADDQGSDKAIGKLTKFAGEAGLTPKQVKDAANWRDVVALIKSKAPAKKEPEEEVVVEDDAQAVEPPFDEGDEVLYGVKDAATKKTVQTKAKVLHVHEDEGKCDLKIGNKVYKGVLWTAIKKA